MGRIITKSDAICLPVEGNCLHGGAKIGTNISMRLLEACELLTFPNDGDSVQAKCVSGAPS